MDNGTDRVYQYSGAASRISGSQSAAATFALAAGNTNPQCIADPPAAGDLLTVTPSTGYSVPGASHATAALDRFFAENAATSRTDLFSADILSALLTLEKKR